MEAWTVERRAVPLRNGSPARGSVPAAHGSVPAAPYLSHGAAGTEPLSGPSAMLPFHCPHFHFVYAVPH